MAFSKEEIQYQLDHIEDNRVSDIVVSNSLCIGLAAIAVLLRFVARSLSKAKVAGDDYMISAALVLATGEVTAGLLTIRFGGAKHAITLTEPIKFAKAVIAVELFYCIAIASVKWSCLLLYGRLFPSKGFRHVLWAVAIFIGLYTIIQTFLVAFQCKPIKAAWDRSIEAECINLSTMSTVTASLNVATDIVTLALPLKLSWRLQLPRAQRLQLCGIFLLGSFVCVVSIYRVTIIGNLSRADAPWADVDPCVWSAVEVCVGIVSACLPTLRPLWTFFKRPRPITRNLQGWSLDSDEPRNPGGSRFHNTLAVLKWSLQHTTSSTSDVEHTHKTAI